MGTVNLTKKTVNLTKGQTINLTKSSDGLKSVLIGLGWDAATDNGKTVTEILNPGFFGKLFGKQPRTIERRTKGNDIDCDAWVLLTKGGKYTGKSSDLVYYGSLKYYVGSTVAIEHHGDNLVGGSVGDDEQITINLEKIPEGYDSILIGVTIYHAIDRGQSFDTVKNTYVRVVDLNDNFEICRFNQSDMSSNPGSRSFIAGRLNKVNGEWEFSAIGDGLRDGSITDAISSYCR